jgi:hypothetical protein
MKGKTTEEINGEIKRERTATLLIHLGLAAFAITFWIMVIYGTIKLLG